MQNFRKIMQRRDGVVYKAEDSKLDRTVALKFLPPYLHLDEEAEKRFIYKAKAVFSFDHLIKKDTLANNSRNL